MLVVVIRQEREQPVGASLGHGPLYPVVRQVERDYCAPSVVSIVFQRRSPGDVFIGERDDHRARCHQGNRGRAGGNAQPVLEAGDTETFDSLATGRESSSGLSVAGARGSMPAIAPVYRSYVGYTTQIL